MNMINEDAYITQDRYDGDEPLPLREWEFAERFIQKGETDSDVIVRREDCTALMWGFIVTQNSFDRLTDLNRNILFMAWMDGEWHLTDKERAEVFLSPWTTEGDCFPHYEACQKISEELGRPVYPAFLAEEIE